MEYIEKAVISLVYFLVAKHYPVGPKRIRRLLRLMGRETLYRQKNLTRQGLKQFINLGANVDQHRIEQVIVNFIHNAIKYAPLSKQIHVFIQEEPGKVKVSVKDTGPGIPHEQLANVFDRYWRADRSGNAYSGLGMGLYICSEIIKKHGGEIGVHSILGQGSIFWFSIPK